MLNKERPDGLYVTPNPLITANLKADHRLCVKEPVAVDVRTAEKV